ncbi:hypothetical protein MJG53_011004 [Ovis ammon polii x Ovis aries]|uniref:Uncharacterized protein n=1 Tax=Ovis ammon polii x Ovis aries TaxID=2918886 RepID=A0ACB9UR75_9CETA|nr:hypothetical protein MJG53_011004 [Ovis ammon polii x Ovis aries]
MLQRRKPVHLEPVISSKRSPCTQLESSPPDPKQRKPTRSNEDPVPPQIDYLFLTFPRILFLVGFVVVLSFLLGSYLCFCLYLTTTNQITNKRYKGD